MKTREMSRGDCKQYLKQTHTRVAPQMSRARRLSFQTEGDDDITIYALLRTYYTFRDIIIII